MAPRPRESANSAVSKLAAAYVRATIASSILQRSICG